MNLGEFLGIGLVIMAALSAVGIGWSYSQSRMYRKLGKLWKAMADLAQGTTEEAEAIGDAPKLESGEFDPQAWVELSEYRSKIARVEGKTQVLLVMTDALKEAFDV
jgi:hypothetical protein